VDETQRSAQAFSSMQTLNAHFGLGDDTQVNSVTICWPSGIVDVINNPTINTHLVVTEGSTLGVEETEMENISMYPNPANENVTLNFVSTEGGNYQISISDINGKLVSSQNYLAKTGNNGQQISLSGMNAGIYLVTITNENGNAQHLKLIKE
jgi:hypothetical protein